MTNERNTVRLYHPEAKVFLDYEVSILQGILDIVRNEADTTATPLLRDYEYRLIEKERLAEDRRQAEIIQRQEEQEQSQHRKDAL